MVNHSTTVQKGVRISVSLNIEKCFGKDLRITKIDTCDDTTCEVLNPFICTDQKSNRVYIIFYTTIKNT